MARIVIKKDDLRPNIVATLVDSNGDAVDLSTATGVKFVMRAGGASTAKVDYAASITTAASGIVTYTWVSGDTDTAGIYNGEFEVNWGSSVYQTFPADGYLEIEIVDDLGGDA